MVNFVSAITYDEGLALSSLARKAAKERAILVEIGSWMGYSASIIAAVIKEIGGQLYCVDHWRGAKGSGLDNEAKTENIYAIFESNLRALDLWWYINTIVKDSLVASKDFGNGSIDFLFIDADHRYESFIADLKAWIPKVKAGGIVCGHDCERYYHSCTPELKQRIDDNLDKDFDGNYHCGVIKGLYDFMGDSYTIVPNTRLWFKMLP